MFKHLIILIIFCIYIVHGFHLCHCLANTISVGSISGETKEEVIKFQEFINYIALNLSDFGIKKGNVIVVDSMGKMVNLLKNKTVDFYVDSPFPSSFVSKKSGAKPLVVRWKKGVRKYHSLLFVHKKSNINTIDDLKGKMIAFEEQFSTSSYFLPKATLLKMGYKMTQKKDFFDNVLKDEIGYTFSYDDENTMVWVLRNRVAGGCLNNLKIKKLAKHRFSDLKIIMKTIDVYRQILVYRPDLNPEIVKKLEEILVNMHMTKKGKLILKNFNKTTKFEKFLESQDQVFKKIDELSVFIENDLNFNSRDIQK